MAITAHENMNLIAVGHKDGTVQLMKGNITRDRASRQVVIHKDTEAGVYVTGKLHVHAGTGCVAAVASSNVHVYTVFISYFSNTSKAPPVRYT